MDDYEPYDDFHHLSDQEREETYIRLLSNVFREQITIWMNMKKYSMEMAAEIMQCDEQTLQHFLDGEIRPRKKTLGLMMSRIAEDLQE